MTNINSISLQPQGVTDFRRILTQLLKDVSVSYGFVADQWSETLNANGEPRRDGDGNVLYHINRNSRDELRRREVSYVKDPYCVDTAKSMLEAKRKAFTLLFFDD